MKLLNFNLLNKLIMGFGIIIVLISILEYKNYFEVNKIAKISSDIYEHPLTVGNTVREIKIEINAMHGSMKDIVLSKNGSEIDSISMILEKHEVACFDKFDIVFSKFLGDPNDVLNAYNALKDWKQIRAEVITLLKEDKISEAVTITKNEGMDHINLINKKVDLMINYANEKAISYREETKQLKNSVIINTIIFAVLILLFSIIIAIIITRSIVKPINKIINKIKSLSSEHDSKENLTGGSNYIKILSDSVDQLEIKSIKLDKELIERKKVQTELEDYKFNLEKVVEQRTQELEETKSLLSNAFNGAAIGMFLANLDGSFYWTNEAFCNIVGYSNEELENIKLDDIYCLEEHQENIDMIEKLKGQEIQKIEFDTIYINKTKNDVSVLLTTSLIEGVGEKPSYLFTQVQDITIQKKNENKIKDYSANLEKEVYERTLVIEEKSKMAQKSHKALTYLLEDVNETREELEVINKKLFYANNELESFSYSVSHDLRAPLRAINGFTNILMEDYVANFDDEAKRLGNVIQDNAIKMGTLIDDLLNFSRIGRTSINYSKIDMKNMVNSIYYEASTPEIRDKFKFTIGDLEDIKGDTNMMRQVWMNLISNSIKFSMKKENPEILVEFSREKERVVYSVKDNGAGFNMKYKEKLFGVFQRLHSENDFKGTGVGLAIVNRIINRHNGEVWAESEGENGAIFYFSLPFQQQNLVH